MLTKESRTLCTHTHTHTLHTHTHTLHPLLSTPRSPSLSPVILLFVMFRGQHQSIRGKGGYSVLKETLFDKNGHSPFSRKYTGDEAAALQSCPENFHETTLSASKGDRRGIFLPVSQRSFSQCSGLVLVLLCCHIKGIGCEFKSFHRRLTGRRKHVAPRYLGQTRAPNHWHGNKTYY